MTRALRGLWRSLVRDRKAGTAIEYGLIAALIVVAMIASLKGVAGTTVAMWNNVNDAMAESSH
jgi:pilus assembly protein Flp/PilA